MNTNTFKLGDKITLQGGLMEVVLTEEHYALSLEHGTIVDIALNYETAENLISHGERLLALPWATAPWTKEGLSAQQLLDNWQAVCNDNWGVE